MKTCEQLTDLEKSVLLIWGKELDYSTTAHYPDNRIWKKIKNTLPGIRDKDLRRINKTLKTSGFILKQPTGGETTFKLSPEGLKCCNIIRDENVI